VEGSEGVDRVFYELASESRLSILQELLAKNYRMQELARKLDLTDTEAFRQLQRLCEALLIQRQPDGSYAITQYGRLLMQFSKSFEFASKFKQCLLTRNLWRLPEPFINRLGELTQASLNTDTIEMLNAADLLIKNVEKYLWVMSDKPMNLMDGGITQRFKESPFTLRLLVDERSEPLFSHVPEIKGIIEKRVIPALPVVLVMSEKYAGINMPSVDGRTDSAIFYGKDPAFLKWASDLFLYYWEQGKSCHPTART
jgi:predicted transcriptional regulator